MFEDILLLKKIADYFNKARKSSIASLITEELNNEIANHPEFKEPEYVKDDLQTIFFKYVTVKRRRSEASIRKSLISNTRNSNEVRETKQAEQKSIDMQISENLNNFENQENIEFTPEENLNDHLDSTIIPQKVFNRMSENIVRKSQFFPGLGSTPNSNNIKIPLEETVLNEQSDNEQMCDDDSTSVIIINQSEHYTQTNSNFEMINGSEINDIIKTYEEEFLFQSQASSSISQKYLKKSPTAAAQDTNKWQESINNSINMTRETLSEYGQRDYNESYPLNLEEVRSPQNGNPEFTQFDRPEGSVFGNIEDNCGNDNNQQENVFYPNTRDIAQPHNRDDNPDLISHEVPQINIDNPVHQINAIIDSEELFPYHQTSTEIPDLPLFCSGVNPSANCNAQSPSLHSNENNGPINNNDNMGNLETSNLEIPVECESQNMILISDVPNGVIGKKRKRNEDEDVEELRPCKQVRFTTDQEEIIDLDNGEDDLFGTGTPETYETEMTRSRSPSLSSIDDLPDENTNITSKEQSIKLTRKQTIKPLVPFKDDKKLDLERRILMSDGWFLWPRSILSSNFKNYDIDSLNEALCAFENQEHAEAQTDRIKCFDQCMQLMARDKLIYQCHYSKKKMNFYLKFPTLPIDVLEYYEIPEEHYSNSLWIKNLGPKYGKRLGAESAPKVVKALLETELEFVNNILQSTLEDLD